MLPAGAEDEAAVAGAELEEPAGGGGGGPVEIVGLEHHVVDRFEVGSVDVEAHPRQAGLGGGDEGADLDARLRHRPDQQPGRGLAVGEVVGG